MLNLQWLQIMASNYVGDGDPHSPLISPLYADLKGISPLIIHVGSDKILLDDSTRLAERAKSAGVDATLNIYDQMWHVFHLTARFVPEAQNAIKELGSFIQKHFEK